MSIDITSELLAPSGSTLKFTEEGQVHRIVISDYRKEQVRDFVSGEPATWDDGNPKNQWVFVGTADGEAAKLYVKDWGLQRQALADALREAGIKAGDSLAGGTLAMKWEGTEPPSKPGLSGAKRFRMKFEPAAKAVVDDDLI